MLFRCVLHPIFFSFRLCLTRLEDNNWEACVFLGYFPRRRPSMIAVVRGFDRCRKVAIDGVMGD